MQCARWDYLTDKTGCRQYENDCQRSFRRWFSSAGLAGAADERLSVVQPVVGTWDVLTQVKYNLQRINCDCCYFINTFRHDIPTLGRSYCSETAFDAQRHRRHVFPAGRV